MRHLLSAVVLIASVVGFTDSSSAKVVKFEIIRIESPAFEGRSFGAVGTYDRIVARATVAVSPDDPHNTIIVDLDRAPRNAQGLVEAAIEFYQQRASLVVTDTEGNALAMPDDVRLFLLSNLQHFALANAKSELVKTCAFPTNPLNAGPRPARSGSRTTIHACRWRSAIRTRATAPRRSRKRRSNWCGTGCCWKTTPSCSLRTSTSMNRATCYSVRKRKNKTENATGRRPC